MVDSWEGTVYMSDKKKVELLRMIKNYYRVGGEPKRWRPIKALQSLVGKLQSQARATSNGQFFLQRLYDAMAGSTVNKEQHALLSPEFFVELEIWKGIIEAGGKASISNLIPRDPNIVIFVDANKSGLGVACFEGCTVTGQHQCKFLSRLVLPDHLVKKFEEGIISINILEAAAAVLAILLVKDFMSPQAWKTAVIRVRGDSTTATSWLSKRSAKGPIGGAVVRLLSQVHAEDCAHLTYYWRAGKLNELADALSRIQDGAVNDKSIKCDSAMSDDKIIQFCTHHYSHIFPQANIGGAVFYPPSEGVSLKLLRALETPVVAPLEDPYQWKAIWKLGMDRQNFNVVTVPI
jgi:hypothetical protein